MVSVQLYQSRSMLAKTENVFRGQDYGGVCGWLWLLGLLGFSQAKAAGSFCFPFVHVGGSSCQGDPF